MSASTTTTQPLSLGDQLELERLEQRVRRLELVQAMLRSRTIYHAERPGGVPQPLLEAIAGFASELTVTRARIRELQRGFA